MREKIRTAECLFLSEFAMNKGNLFCIRCVSTVLESKDPDGIQKECLVALSTESYTRRLHDGTLRQGYRDVRKAEVRSRLKSDFRLIAEYVANKGNPKELRKMMQDHSHPIRHPEEFLDALSEVASDQRFQEIKEQMS